MEAHAMFLFINLASYAWHLFILLTDNYVWLPRILFVTHIDVTTAKTHNSLHNCAHIHCLVFINILKMTMQFFVHGEIQGYMHFMSDAILPGCKYNKSKRNYGILVGRFKFYCHTTNIYL